MTVCCNENWGDEVLICLKCNKKLRKEKVSTL